MGRGPPQGHSCGHGLRARAIAGYTQRTASTGGPCWRSPAVLPTAAASRSRSAWIHCTCRATRAQCSFTANAGSGILHITCLPLRRASSLFMYRCAAQRWLTAHLARSVVACARPLRQRWLQLRRPCGASLWCTRWPGRPPSAARCQHPCPQRGQSRPGQHGMPAAAPGAPLPARRTPG